MKTIPVFYTDKMVAEIDSYSPSAKKPRLVVQEWINNGYPIEIKKPTGLNINDLSVAHDREYVRGVLIGQIHNGFGDRSPEAASSLRYTTGSMLAAAKEAIKNGNVAAAPCSGFHHATYHRGGGFCTFNGLMIAALTLQQQGYARRIGILDLDQHYGDGTADIIRQLKVANIVHFSGGQKPRKPKHAQQFLDFELPRVMQTFKTCDVILYQAGADPHVNDPLGGWLTTRELLTRDTTVFTMAKQMHVPIAWNLAGGYQRDIQKILDIHNNTMATCVQTYITETE